MPVTSKATSAVACGLWVGPERLLVVTEPQKGIDQLLIQKKCNGDPEDIARFLLRTDVSITSSCGCV